MCTCEAVCRCADLNVVLAAINQDVSRELIFIHMSLNTRVLLTCNTTRSDPVPQKCPVHVCMMVITNNVTDEVVVSVDRVVSLLSVLAHNDSPEVISEELVIGPQIQGKVPVSTNIHCCILGLFLGL